jgi:hypothetical protein
MKTETIEARGHTTRDGMLILSVNVGVPDADVSVVLHVKPLSAPGELDANGWPKAFFERVAGSMPELSRAPQGPFEQRLAFE